MLQPKRTKFRRPHRVSYEGHVKGKNKMVNGDFGLAATEAGWVTSRQIEAARIAITRHMKRLGQLWINIFPHMAKTKKPAEVRMGSGKGAPDHYVAVVKKGKLMFELTGVSEEIAREALRLGMHKLPILSKIVSKEVFNNEDDK
jgi:large subunit ribosomal protein L16